MSDTDLSPTAQKILLLLKDREPQNGIVVPYVKRVHKELEDAGLIWVNQKVSGAGARIRCSPDGVALAKSLDQ